LLRFQQCSHRVIVVRLYRDRTICRKASANTFTCSIGSISASGFSPPFQASAQPLCRRMGAEQQY